jgi:hypothetical protein
LFASHASKAANDGDAQHFRIRRVDSPEARARGRRRLEFYALVSGTTVRTDATQRPLPHARRNGQDDHEHSGENSCTSTNLAHLR